MVLRGIISFTSAQVKYQLRINTEDRLMETEMSPLELTTCLRWWFRICQSHLAETFVPEPDVIFRHSAGSGGQPGVPQRAASVDV